jgi:hypothetical protein
MRDEFGEGFDHLRLAAAHAAGTAAGMIAPRLDSVRERLEPTYDKSKSMARDSARRANKIARRATGKKKESRMAKRWPMMVGGLMIAGVAAGAVGALMSRRRQRKWNDYGTTGTTGTGPISSIKDETRATASSIADTAKDKATDVLGQMKTATESTGTAASPQLAGTSTRTSDFSAQGESYKPSSSATGSRNSRP